jgi:hypothetical protein
MQKNEDDKDRIRSEYNNKFEELLELQSERTSMAEARGQSSRVFVHVSHTPDEAIDADVDQGAERVISSEIPTFSPHSRPVVDKQVTTQYCPSMDQTASAVTVNPEKPGFAGLYDALSQFAVDSKRNSRESTHNDRGRQQQQNLQRQTVKKVAGGNGDDASPDASPQRQPDIPANSTRRRRNGNGGGSPDSSPSGSHRSSDRIPNNEKHNANDHHSPPPVKYFIDGSSAPKKKQWIKLQEYNGDSDLEAFLAHFQMAAKYNGYDQEAKAAHLMAQLRGKAQTCLWAFGESLDWSYDQIVQVLNDRFGVDRVRSKFQEELRCRRRKKGESISELLTDIHRLVSRAYGTTQAATKLEDFSVIDYFLKALNDPELELKVREKEPKDLDQAGHFATRLESHQLSVTVSNSNGNSVAKQAHQVKATKTRQLESVKSNRDDNESMELNENTVITEMKKNGNNKKNKKGKISEKVGNEACTVKQAQVSQAISPQFTEGDWATKLAHQMQEVTKELKEFRQSAGVQPEQSNDDNQSPPNSNGQLQQQQWQGRGRGRGRGRSRFNRGRGYLNDHSSSNSKACYSCGQLGHYAAFCPQGQNTVYTGQLPYSFHTKTVPQQQNQPTIWLPNSNSMINQQPHAGTQ